MTTDKTPPKETSDTPKALPTFGADEDGVIQVLVPDEGTSSRLFNVETSDAGEGLLTCLLNGLGRAGENHRNTAVALLSELQPRDAIESMLISQMTVTHIAMTSMSRRMVDCSSGYQVREAPERSVTRLSRTYLAQMDALKKHRATAQQTVRVERVNVESGGQAIVGDVAARGEG